MHQKKIYNKNKKTNISLRRKLGILYSRIMLFFKVAVIIFLYLLFCTKYLESTKYEIAQNIYERAADIGFRLENVLIEGQENAQESSLLATLNADKGTPIFTLDIQEIQHNLQNNPWIKDVYVERKLPNTLYINLFERIPIAIWQINGQLFLIDEEGYKVTNNIENFSNLLHVVGNDANIYASKLLADLSKYPELLQKVTSAVRYSGLRWNLNLAQNITIKMPEVGFEQALHYLVELNKSEKLFNQQYKTIDLRDANKYYIEKY